MHFSRNKSLHNSDNKKSEPRAFTAVRGPGFLSFCGLSAIIELPISEIKQDFCSFAAVNSLLGPVHQVLDRDLS